jgi:RHS repeat-associated protein
MAHAVYSNEQWADPRQSRHESGSSRAGLDRRGNWLDYRWADAYGQETGRTLLREFLWGDPGRFPEPVAMVAQSGAGAPTGESLYHYLHDALGSVVALTDSTGTVVERYTYDPYGKTLIETWDSRNQTWLQKTASPLGNPFMWTGQRYDAGTGLYAFLYRTYSPGLGRWLQRDPAEYVDGVNLFQYVRCRPTRWTDPFGLACCQFPGGSGTDSLQGICPNDSGQQDPEAFQKACVAAGGTYTKCDCVPNSQGCPLEAPGSATGDDWCKEYFYNPYHQWPGGDADSCYRGLNANSGDQCCYDKSGCLIGDDASGAGTADMFPPSSTEDKDGDCNADGQTMGHFLFEMTPIGYVLIDPEGEIKGSLLIIDQAIQ